MDEIYAWTGAMVILGLIIYGFKCIFREITR